MGQQETQEGRKWLQVAEVHAYYRKTDVFRVKSVFQMQASRNDL